MRRRRSSHTQPQTVQVTSVTFDCQYVEFANLSRLSIDPNPAGGPQLYLRVGTTLLVLDAIEAGTFRTPPAVRRPIQALHDICQDDSLTHEFFLRDGQAVTALQVQRYYLSGCRAFLNQQTEVPAEAWEVLRLWSQSLDQLEQRDADKESLDPLIGSIDWVTKKYLLDRAGADASWHERKKIDLRYHELSEDGYYAMFHSAGLTTPLIEREAIERATRLAPPNSPATMRGLYIREFADGEDTVAANWKVVVIGQRWGAKTLRLASYGRFHRQSQDRASGSTRRGKIA